MNTEQLITQSKLRFSHSAAKQLLREKYQAKLIFAYNNGMFEAGPELLTVLFVCKDDFPVILDLYKNPIKVNKSELSNLVHERWQEQMNAWLVEFENMQRTR